LLTLASAKLNGYEGLSHIHLASCVELIHNATLLHDDVIDNSTKRRGRTTPNIVFGNQASILIGDYLLSRCFEIMVDVGSLEILKLLSSVSAEISQGEVLQLQHEKQININEQTYLNIIEKKTASLFGAATKVGAILGKKSENEKSALLSYGKNLGMVFQITDDILDYFSTKNFGKDIGNDFLENKITLPIIVLFQKANDEEKKIIEGFFKVKGKKADLDYMLSLFKKYDVMNACKNRARYFSEVASDALGIYKDTRLRKILKELCFDLVNRAS
jgi:octaprenyl-diphosphate synthase